MRLLNLPFFDLDNASYLSEVMNFEYKTAYYIAVEGSFMQRFK